MHCQINISAAPIWLPYIRITDFTRIAFHYFHLFKAHSHVMRNLVYALRGSGCRELGTPKWCQARNQVNDLWKFGAHLPSPSKSGIY